MELAIQFTHDPRIRSGLCGTSDPFPMSALDWNATAHACVTFPFPGGKDEELTHSPPDWPLGLRPVPD